MATFKQKCEQYFGTTDLYEVLSVSKDASVKECDLLIYPGFKKWTISANDEVSVIGGNAIIPFINKLFAVSAKKFINVKKAYHKLSLLVHPDRVDENEKEIATEKFKVLGKIHSILQDEGKRKIYDDCGDFDEESDDLSNWLKYWTSMFKPIEISDIEKYEKEYIGSERERLDLKKAYESTKGNMGKILEMVSFSNCDSEPRFIEMVREMIDKEEVPEYEAFFNESKAKKLRRLKKWEAERQEAEKIDINQLSRELEANVKKRAKSFGNFMMDLEAKYAPKGKKSRQALTDGKGKKTGTTPTKTTKARRTTRSK